MWRFILVAKLLITVGLLTWLVSKIDLALVLAQMRRGDVGLLLAGTIVLALQPVLGALRWRFILVRLDLHMPFRHIVWWTYAGTFFNQVLPVSGGDGVRIWMAARAGGPLAVVINSVVLDRVVMILSLVALVIISAPWFEAVLSPDQLVLLSTMALASVGTGLLFVFLADKMPQSLRRWGIAAWLASLSGSTRALLLSPASACGVFALSTISVLNLMVSTTLFALAFGATADALRILMLLPPVIAASTLPISVGGWGTRELAMVAALGIASVSSEIAVLASIWLGLASVLISLPGAFCHFALGKPGSSALPQSPISAR